MANNSLKVWILKDELENLQLLSCHFWERKKKPTFMHIQDGGGGLRINCIFKRRKKIEIDVNGNVPQLTRILNHKIEN